MSTTTAHRVLELLVGFALLGYSVYEIYVGEARGKFRYYSRYDEPFSFWTSVLLQLGIAAAFLFGASSWRS